MSKPSGYDDIQGQYLGLFKVRADHVPRLEEIYRTMDRGDIYDGNDFANMYMTSFLQRLSDTDWQVKGPGRRPGWRET